MTTAIVFCCAGGCRASFPASGKSWGEFLEGASHDGSEGADTRACGGGGVCYVHGSFCCCAEGSNGIFHEGRIGLCRVSESSPEGGREAQSARKRSRGCGGGGKPVRSALRRVPRRHGGGRPESAEPACRQGARVNAWHAVLDSHQWSRAARHAGVVEAAGTAALADCKLSEVTRSEGKGSTVTAS